MEILYHRTCANIEEVHRLFTRLERCSTENVLDTEKNIQKLLDTIGEDCSKLDILVNKEVPNRRTAARVQVDQLKYDLSHYQTSLQNAVHRRLQREQEARDREDLLQTRFQSNAARCNTTIDIDHSLQHNERMHSARRNMDDLLGQGSGILTSLREQRSTLKGAHKRILDLVNTLGLSNTVMRLIEKRTYQDKYVLFGGMVVTCLVMFLVFVYLA